MRCVAQLVANMLSTCQERQWAHIDTVMGQVNNALQDEVTTRVRPPCPVRPAQILYSTVHAGEKLVLHEIPTSPFSYSAHA